MFVLDASVALSALLGQTQADAADAIIARIAEEGAVVPTHWPLEIANALAREVARGRVDRRTAEALAREPILWAVSADDATYASALARTIELAMDNRLSSYDAAYLELCLRRGLPLATFDAALAAVADQFGVPLLVPATGPTGG